MTTYIFPFPPFNQIHYLGVLFLFCPSSICLTWVTYPLLVLRCYVGAADLVAHLSSLSSTIPWFLVFVFFSLPFHIAPLSPLGYHHKLNGGDLSFIFIIIQHIIVCIVPIYVLWFLNFLWSKGRLSQLHTVHFLSKSNSPTGLVL